ncbi:MAG: Lrp/AsnC family transcriptional regulator [Thermoplasmata archaeon]|nr:Lrp/AsnC family transcriptional regulator [Candidatus Sysuiplasma acidicola]MBX8637047.1 Lrp/AsnC family transcriptional regulator [Candidatus Sysuiplasma acidicola]MBX8645424.1 Lrp/AsnC family transcriptional regulator [Candidatus Sysuiplasma acidicola]MDH2906033.1 Lrp/AsnC family transcriptional regulator [Methanomassiliicoccales archaeon]
MDEKDILILELLQRNSRTSLKEISRQVKLAAPTVHERVQSLMRKGVITGFTTLVDPKSVNLDITAFIMLYFKTGGSLGDQKVVDLINSIGDIEECHHLAGDEDLIIKVKTENMATLEDIILRLSRSGHFSRTKSIIALSTIKESAALNLSHKMREIEEQHQVKENE